MTEYLAEQPEVAALSTFDTDAAFVEIARTKAKELGLTVVHEILLLDQAATRRLPWADGAFDLVLAVGVVEHLPERHRRAQVDEYWRVLAPGGHIAFLDTPNRAFPARDALGGASARAVAAAPSGVPLRAARPPGTSMARCASRNFVADGTGWRNATLAECLPSRGRAGVVDVTEEAGYGCPILPRHCALANSARAAPAVRRARPARSRPPASRRRSRCRT